MNVSFRLCIPAVMAGLLTMHLTSCAPAPLAEAPTEPPTLGEENPDLHAGIEYLEIEPVWSAARVPFDLLTHKGWQFVAYYDANRQMSVAQRRLGEREWKITKLDSWVEWDSHNYITMAFDADDVLHLSGNLHVNPLIYFRAEKPLDASTLQPIHRMTGELEQRATYPTFFNSPEGELIFTYRDGSSGSGNNLFNMYDRKTRSWRRLLEQPLIDGEGERNAYPLLPPVAGPDGYFHLSWVWRDTIHAETSHSPGYARSRNLVDWMTACGQPLELPIRFGTPGVIIDPIPVEAGILNGSNIVGFDLDGLVVLAYHKFDDEGNTQLYFARHDGSDWQIHQATDWNYRWEFGGGGSLTREIRHSGLHMEDGQLVVSIQHPKYPNGTYRVDPVTLRLMERVPSSGPSIPPRWRKVESDFPEMQIVWRSDSTSDSAGAHYRLRWEAMPHHRDQPRPKPWPDPAMLRLLVIPE